LPQQQQSRIGEEICGGSSSYQSPIQSSRTGFLEPLHFL
jgi:hypothetical protein